LQMVYESNFGAFVEGPKRGVNGGDNSGEFISIESTRFDT